MKIAMIGTGGVGGYLGAKLCKGGNEVIFVARGEHLAAMRRNGLLLKSHDGDIHVRNALFGSDLEGAGPCDLVIVAVKSFDTDSAAAIASKSLGPSTVVLTIQNGIENEQRLADALGSGRILGGVAYIAATIESPGVVRHEWGAPMFKFGEMDGKQTDRCASFEEMFRTSAIDARAVGDIQRVIWEKWVFICGAGGMTAYCRLPMDRILADDKQLEMFRKVVAEAASVARAKGIDRFEGLEDKVLLHCRRLAPGSTSSLYYDVTHGKRNEVEALNGAAVRFGKEFGVPTPANEAIATALRGVPA